MLRNSAVSLLALLTLIGCGTRGSNSSPVAKSDVPRTSPVASPTPDERTRQFVELVHNYWVDLIAADGNAPIVCLKGPIQPPACEARAIAQLAVQEKFLDDLEVTPAPPQFAALDKVLLDELPRAISDLQAMISAAKSGNKDVLVQATSTYVDEMEPHITDAVDAIDTSMVHQR